VDIRSWRQRLGNQELETYTSRPQNVKIQNGNLVITAQEENSLARMASLATHSARLKTQDLSPGVWPIRSAYQDPKGQGIWPAFWMLGNDITKDGWPKCGRIDIMENVGHQPRVNHGSLHGPSSVAPTAD